MNTQAIHIHSEGLFLREREIISRKQALPKKQFSTRWAFALLLLSVVAYLYATNHNAVQGFAVRGAEQSLAAAQDENQQLRIEEAQLRSLGRIMDAKNRFGLVEATPESKTVSFVTLNESLALR
ncbi:MAG: hypothetical protein WCG84_03735 [Candidatus Moraniibacteriota bacterium]